MAISEAHKRANQRWDRKNMLTVGVRLKRSEAEEFKRFAASQGRTANAILKEYVYNCLGKEYSSIAELGIVEADSEVATSDENIATL